MTGAQRRALWACLIVTAAAPQLLSFASLTDWARDELALTERQAILVPLSLDGAGIASAILVASAAAAGRGGGLARFMLWACTIASAAANARHGAIVGGDAIWLGLAPIFGTGMLEVALRYRHREALEALGAVQPPLPRFGLVRWLRFPAPTFAAWSIAVRDSLTSRLDAIAAVAPPVPLAEIPPPPPAPAPEPAAALPPPDPAPEPLSPAAAPGDAPQSGPGELPPSMRGTPLGALSKGEAMRLALNHQGTGNAEAARRFLAGHGVKVSSGTAARAGAAWRAERKLRVVGS